MKATRQYFPVVLFTLHQVVLFFESMDEIVKCDHSHESCMLSSAFGLYGAEGFLNQL